MHMKEKSKSQEIIKEEQVRNLAATLGGLITFNNGRRIIVGDFSYDLREARELRDRLREEKKVTPDSK
jgi:hypothetical protein